jgi:hypothetical protein
MKPDPIVIPEWDDTGAVEESMRSPLQRFVHDNEPAGLQDEKEFRKQLQELLDWAIGA